MATSTPPAPRKRPPRKPAVQATPALILAGPPGSVRGRITLTNTGSERLVIRGATIHLPKQAPIAVPLTALVGPGASTEAVVSADLGGDWPAGSLRGELEVNGQRQGVEIRVAESIGINVTPSEVLAVAGDTDVSLSIRNYGNVPIRLARITRGRLVPHDRDDPQSELPDATLTLAKAITVEPGAELVLSAQVSIPRGLAADRRHRARLPLGPADLLATVLPTDASTSTASTARKARTRTTTRKES
jgi:hypothetical protein